MVQYIAAFRSRSQTMRLFQIAKSSRIPCTIINTPREASVGCGISLAYNPEDHGAVKSIYLRGDFNALIGFYKMERDANGRIYIQRI